MARARNIKPGFFKNEGHYYPTGGIRRSDHSIFQKLHSKITRTSSRIPSAKKNARSNATTFQIPQKTRG